MTLTKYLRAVLSKTINHSKKNATEHSNSIKPARKKSEFPEWNTRQNAIKALWTFASAQKGVPSPFVEYTGNRDCAADCKQRNRGLSYPMHTYNTV